MTQVHSKSIKMHFKSHKKSFCPLNVVNAKIGWDIWFQAVVILETISELPYPIYDSSKVCHCIKI